MLLTLLAILGVAVVGTVGVGTVSSLVKNRNRGRNNTEPSPEETQPIREQPRRERERERDLDPEAERTQDTPTSGYDDVWGRTMRQMRQREEERAASQLEESSVTADPVASQPTASTSADNIQSDAPTSGYDDVWGEFLEQRRRERENANGLEESSVIEDPVAQEESVASQAQGESENIDDELNVEKFKSVIDNAKKTMQSDIEKYKTLVKEMLETQDLEPYADEKKEIVSEAMNRSIVAYVNNKTNMLDKFLKKVNSENVNELAKEVLEKFKYLTPKAYFDSLCESGYTNRVLDKTKAYFEIFMDESMQEFLERSAINKDLYVCQLRSNVTNIAESFKSDIGDKMKTVNSFVGELKTHRGYIDIEFIKTSEFEEVKNKVLDVENRIEDLENLEKDTEKIIDSYKQIFENIKNKIDFDVLENTVKEVRIIKNQLKGIDEKETVVGKLNNLEKVLNKSFAENLEKKINAVKKDICDGRLREAEESIKRLWDWQGRHMRATEKDRDTIKNLQIDAITFKSLNESLNQKIQELTSSIAELSEKIGENNIENDKDLAGKLKELLETDSGMIMFANNFEKMLKSKNKEVRKIVDDAIADKIKRYLKNKPGKEILVNNITNIIENNSEISNNIVTQVIDRIREVSSQSTLQGEENNITIQGNVGVCDLDEIFEEVLASNNIVVQVNVYNNSNKQK